MRAVILAAGTATRLRPLTDNTPKCLLKVGDKCILQLTIDNIIANNIDEVIIVTGYLQEMIKEFVAKTYPKLNVKYIYNEVYDSTNNIYSLWLTKSSILDDEMLLMDSDIIFDKEIITRLMTSEHPNCLALKRHDVKEEEIKVKVDERGRVMEIGKTMKPSEAIGESIGIEKFSVEALNKLFLILDRKMLVDKTVNQFYEAAFEELVSGNHDVDMYIVDTTDLVCMEVDTAEDLKAAATLV